MNARDRVLFQIIKELERGPPAPFVHIGNHDQAELIHQDKRGRLHRISDAERKDRRDQHDQ